MTLSGGSGTVLCIGNHGHLSFELAHEGRCADEVDGHAHSEGAVVSELAAAPCACCGDCVDLELSSNAFVLLTHKAISKSLLKSMVLRPLATLPMERHIAADRVGGLRPHEKAPPGDMFSLLTQRITVLRI